MPLTNEHARHLASAGMLDLYRQAPDAVNCPGEPDDGACLDDPYGACKACFARGWADEGVDIEELVALDDARRQN